ncbi:ATP-binding protein [Candidatus Lokiarchaeum ossiferum]|uniref:ATP-binding protein n=1 Tax=Candidatus Lokiarchaeum ossiferum TaxID=2951803 RepID=UPI00352E2ABA
MNQFSPNSNTYPHPTKISSHLYFFIFLLLSGGFLVSFFYIKGSLESEHNQLLANQAAIALKHEFDEKLMLLNVIEADWVTVDDNSKLMNESRFNTRMSNILGDISGISALAYVNSSGIITFRYPELPNSTLIGTSICHDPDGTLNTAFLKANSTGTTTISPPKILQINQSGYVFYDPIYYKNENIGCLALIFTTSEYINHFISDQPLLSKYDLQVWDNGSLIYNNCPDSAIRHVDNKSSSFEVIDRNLEIYIQSHEHGLFNLSNLLIFLLWVFFIGVIFFLNKSLITQNKSLQTALQEKIETENELRQAAKMESLGRLAGGIAHDFNNILTTIQGFSDLALLDLRDNKSVKNYLQEIQLAENRAKELIKQLLSFSHKQMLSPKYFDLNERISSMRSLLLRLIREDVTLIINLDETCKIIIYADLNQFETALMNLVINARDAIDLKGRIEIKTTIISVKNPILTSLPHPTPIGKYALISVSDNGKGMAPDIIDRIFEPFFTTKGIEKGTGLGLSTVFGIVTRSQGYISVNSMIDQGSTFNLYFPLKEVPTSMRYENGVSSKPDNSQLVHNNNKYKILIVEDEVNLQNLLKTALVAANYQIWTAFNGIEALSLISQNKIKFDLIISDMIMPKMGGEELFFELSKKSYKIKMLFISGYAPSFLNKKSDINLFNRFLPKPFSIQQLLTKIREIL